MNDAQQLNTIKFGLALKNAGFDFFSGVPCSYLSNLINYAINNCNYIAAANEGEAVAAAAGATLAGKKGVALMQNSGLTNAVSPITSLLYVFRVPILGFVSLRGGISDEPQHELMGEITTDILDVMRIQWEFLSTEENEALNQVARAKTAIENKKTFFFVVKKGVFSKEVLINKLLAHNQIVEFVDSQAKDELPARLSVIEKISETTSEFPVIAATGYTGRELYETGDKSNNLYMVGSMGCAGSIGLGIALSSNKPTIVLDGDGAVLMHMGSLVVNGYYRPKMLHIVFDNNCYESTGGQSCTTTNAALPNIAKESGYSCVIHAHTTQELLIGLERWKKNPVLTFLYLKIKPGTKEALARPSITPAQVATRLEKFLNP